MPQGQGRTRDPALRGVVGSEMDFQAFEDGQAPSDGASLRATSWTSVLALSAAVGLAVGVLGAPARAEEQAALAAATEAAAPAAPAKELSKEERVIAQQEQLKSETGKIGESGYARATKNRRSRSSIIKDKPEKKAEQAAPSQTGAAIVEEEGAKRKVIISPADELDEDEQPLSRTNRPLLVFLALFPPAVYLVFYVLGSLDVI